MINQAQISHYKSISDATLKFHDRNIIVGPNGSGKSNVLDAIYFLHDCISDDIDTAVTKRHGIDSIRQWSRTRPYNIVISVQLSNNHGIGSYKVVISSSKSNYKIIEEIGSWHGSHPRERFKAGKIEERRQSWFNRGADGHLVVDSEFQDCQTERANRVDPNELFLTQLSARLPILPYTLFKPIADELISFSKYNIYPNTLRNPQLVSKENVLAEDGINLASILKRVNGNRRFARNKEDILSGIKSLMPSVVDFQVKSAGGYFVPVLRVEEVNQGTHDFNLSQISDGTLRTLGLLAAFYQPSAPDKIGVEEPEQMIHPGALPILAEAVNDFTGHGDPTLNRQTFLTTHSPTLLDLFDPKFIIWTRFKKGVTECGSVRPRQIDIIKDRLFSAGELLTTEGFF